LHQDRVRDNDRVFIIGSLATCHKQGRNIAWEFTKKNWEKLHAMYKGQFLIARLVKVSLNITKGFVSIIILITIQI